MSEINKISVNGVIYDISSSTGGDIPSDVQSQLDNLNKKIDEEISLREESDITLQSNIDSEKTAREEADKEINSNIELESNSREEADTKLQSNIDLEKSERLEADKELRDNIDSERTSREEADTTLQGNIDSEKTAREKADTTLQGNIDSEKTAREEADLELNDKIDSKFTSVSDSIESVESTINDNIIPELEKSVKYQEFELNGDKRKTIQLANYDSITGVTTTGGGVNIAMVSKWDKVDLGSAQVEINLNGSADHPTYNDKEQLAFLSDVKNADVDSLKEQVDSLEKTVSNLNTTVIESNSSLNNRIDEESQKLSDRIDTEIVPNITDLEKEKVSYFEADKNGINTKNILLDNYSSILGKDTKGTVRNLIMLSKWDKCDIGASGVEINLNGSTERPTYNDDKQIAFLEDINNSSELINLVKKDDLTYELQVGDRIAGTISIPKDQFLKTVSFDEETSEMTFVFDTLDGEKTTVIDMSKLIDTYVAGNGLSLDGYKFSVLLDPSTEAYLEVSESGIKLVGIDKALADKANTSDLVNVVKYQEFEYQGETRKTIQLANYDSISGATTTGSGVNIAMVSKWDKVDLGSAQVEINLNGSAEHPTYNDVEQLAFVKDVENAVSDKVTSQELQAAKEELSQNFNTAIQGEKERAEAAEESLKNSIDSLGVYSIGKVGSFYDIPDKLAQKDICTNANNVVLTFVVSNTVSGDEGGYCTNIYTQKKVYQTLYWKNTVSGRTLTVTEAGEVQTAEFKPSGEDQVFLLNKAINGTKFFALTTESTPEEIKAAMTGVISKQLITSEDLDRCYVYGFMIKEEVMNGSIMVGWNGSAYTFTQVGYLNPKSTPVVRSITVNVSPDGVYSVIKNGFSGTILTNTNISSYINPLQESIVDIQGIISVLSGKLTLLENKVDMLQTAASEDVPSFDGSSPINDSAKMYEVTGGNITNTNTITAKNIVMNDSTISNNARLSVSAKGAEFNNLSISGSFPKNSGGNAVVKINDSNNVSFSNLTFDSSDVYNGIEIGLNSEGENLPKNVLFDNCKFTGKFTNNAILVFGTQENATITLNNCSFESISNALRISNKANVRGLTVNIINCSVDEWESRPDYSDYVGFLILEDYTSKGSEAIAENNLFGDGKITINFINLMYKGVKVLPSDIKSVCGTKDENQVVYVCHDYADEGATVVPYDESIYPTVTFK